MLKVSGWKKEVMQTGKIRDKKARRDINHIKYITRRMLFLETKPAFRMDKNVNS